jgi:hypothetical protein
VQQRAETARGGGVDGAVAQSRSELDRQQWDREVEQACGELGDSEPDVGKGQGLAVVFEQWEQEYGDAHDPELAEHQQRAGGQRWGVGGGAGQEVGSAQHPDVERVGGDERGGGGQEEQPDHGRGRPGRRPRRSVVWRIRCTR